MIRISPIRLVGPDNEQIGVVETPEALRRAEEQGLDLVEVVPDSRPPICKIMDYGKYRYELSKKKQPTQKGNEIKEIRLGRSIKIDPHDVAIRVQQARRFLMEGNKVQVIQRFRGREIAHKELGLNNLRRFVEELEDISKIEIPPRWVNRQSMLMLAPDRDRIKSLKARIEQERKEDAKAKEREAEEERKHREAVAALEAREAAEADDDDDSDEDDDSKQKKPSRVVSNPVEDEIADLLGE